MGNFRELDGELIYIFELEVNLLPDVTDIRKIEVAAVNENQAFWELVDSICEESPPLKRIELVGRRDK